MDGSRAVEIEGLINRQRLGPVNFWYVAVLLAALTVDGFDLQVMGFTAPSLVRDWHVSRAALAPVFSASLVGILFGAFVFGALGDRFGRKRAVIAASLLYGLVSVACLWSTSLWQLGLLRFVTGLGIGGVIPNVLALSTELAPKRHRAFLTSLVLVGLNLGSALPGVARTWFPAEHEWRALFLVGGLAPIAVAALVALTLPESILFLVHRGVRRPELVRRARRLDPTLDIDAQTRFVLAEPTAPGASSLKAIFAGRFAVITPLLWLVFAATLFTIFIRSSWMPLLLDDAGVSRGRVASVTALVEAGGSISGVLAGFVIMRFGLAWVIGLLLLAGAGMAALARVDVSGYGLEFAALACGLGSTGGQAAMNTAASLIYPVNCRPTGVGAALGVGRFGAILGPLIGGAIVALGATPRDMFLVPLVPLALAAVALLLLRRLADVRNSPAPAMGD